MRYLLTILTIALALPLLSVAPVPPAPIVLIVRHPLVTRVIPQAQACSEQRARELSGPYLRAVVVDARGIPIGEVAAWSCSGDVPATIAEFERRKAAMTGGAR